MKLVRLAAMVAAVLSFGSTAGTVFAQTVKIGAPLALTGGLADEGRKQQAAYDLWLERVNAAGGINVGGKRMKVELLAYDYQTSEQRAQQLAERLITQEGVHFMTAPFGSGHTKVVAGVAERYGVPIIAVASAEPVHNQGYKNLFGTLAPSIGLIDAMITQFRQAMPGMKRVAILGREDVFPKIMATSLSAQAKKAGLEVVFEGFYPVGALDHAASVTAMRAAKPDWIYVTGYSKDLILVRKQMADLKLDAPIITMITGPAYKEFIDGLGPLAENVTSATWWHWSAAYKADDVFGTTQAFTDAVRKKTGQDPDYVHASSAAALIVLQKAIETAGTLDRDKVRDTLAKFSVNTFYGPVKFREDGMNSNRSLPIIQVQAGKPVVLSPDDMKQASMKLIPAR